MFTAVNELHQEKNNRKQTHKPNPSYLAQKPNITSQENQTMRSTFFCLPLPLLDELRANPEGNDAETNDDTDRRKQLHPADVDQKKEPLVKQQQEIKPSKADSLTSTSPMPSSSSSSSSPIIWYQCQHCRWWQKVDTSRGRPVCRTRAHQRTRLDDATGEETPAPELGDCRMPFDEERCLGKADTCPVGGEGKVLEDEEEGGCEDDQEEDGEEEEEDK